jgi:hypothetical protein
MRTIDSALTLCKKYKHDLTVLWIRDFTLNCSFNELFVIPSIEDFELQIVECNNGFPEFYLRFSGDTHPALKKYIAGHRRVFVEHPLNEVQKSVLKEIQRIPTSNMIINNSLFKMYSSKKYVDSMSVRQMDNIFFDKISNIIHPLFKNSRTSCFISSCYRFCPVENNYVSFYPVENICNKMEDTTNRFEDTTGIHIRRSDHLTSIKYSTTDKFIATINQILGNRPKATFFLSTDDKNTKESILYEFKSKIIVNNIESYNRNEADAVKDALTDLFCLSKTKKIYGSHHSTFSQIAADIGRIEEITVK